MLITYTIFSNVDVGRAFVNNVSHIIHRAYLFDINILLLLELISVEEFDEICFDLSL